ncbi:alpha-galactosidase [Bifidobacterium adolescentis]|uniref:alpha-galactosidase n=2 Tax=Bifidobacterium adolescentis TaxID=1680 RepID=A0A0G9MBS2_BIFAD|nr:alpha-galactosidase [Bifidobacterium adolescentis]MBV3835083.1 alpha-galactosidase [Bifidobacterium sp. MSK.17.10]KAB5972229.1 alpha-galactosidase [Bifidobacterium adolescentis]KAB5974979.1 alpha-galactosidase [Bifidobacterium adolescentis]KAB5976383.1 alpha-galactosidase [Bifidobacterium adolescentis]
MEITMSQNFTWNAGPVSMVFAYDDDQPVTMASLSIGDTAVRFPYQTPLAEVMTTDTGHMISCNKLTHTVIGRELRYSRHQTDVIGHRNELKIVLEDEDRDLEVTVRYSVDDRAPMVQTDVTVTNMGLEPVLLDSVTSWSSTFGLPADAAESAEPDLGDWDLLEGRFDWLAEGRWHRKPVRDLIPAIGQELTEVDPRQSHQVVSTGTWSTGTNVPLAILESEKQQLAWLFQIEHNGAWRWDVQDNTSDGCVALSGPTNENHSWSEELHLGEAFTTVPASFTVAHDFDGVVANVTDYRREVRSPHRDNAEPSVVFNDYMNTIYGDPTTEKELPLIEAAGKTGIGIFVIDCGWYDDTGNWWPSVGEWMPSKTRFPGKKGIVEVIDAIKDAGMIPGIWIEPEVIGVKSPMAEKLPDSAFFQRHGKRVVEQERYLLDLRDPAARKHLDSVIDRLVSEYGIGYFKFDYNVSPGAGTDYDADAPGAGLLGHNRAYSDWIDGLRERYPDVILENCSSGGMREDFAQTSRFQVQSTSDQQDFRLYPVIAAAAPMMVLPEQAASWAYPQSDMGAEETAFNINTTFLGRFFLSGYLNRMNASQLAWVQEGVDAYKKHVQPVIGKSKPFWPMGLPGWTDKTLALGLDAGDRALITVWSRDSEGGELRLHLDRWQGRDGEAAAVYPVEGYEQWPVRWDKASGELAVTVPAEGGYISRTFEVNFN